MKPLTLTRAATAHDAPIIAQHRFPDEHGTHLRAYAAWLQGAFERGAYLGWLTEADGRVIAGAGLTLLDWGPTRSDPNPLRARLVNVYTHPDWRRQGHAHTLTQSALRAAQARGIHTVTLSATPTARALYARLGFRPAEAEMVWRHAAP